MKRPLIALVAAASLAGCSSLDLGDRAPEGPGSARTPAGQLLAPRDAMARLSLGHMRKADVGTALGRAIVVPFDSGYEVWVYRWPGAERSTRSATELVLLFDPSGLLTKARLRPGVDESSAHSGQ
jgi:hypothetical protein